MDSQDSSTINKVDLPDSSDASIVQAMNEEERNKQDRD